MKKNVILNVFYQIIILAIPLIVSPYISRVLGAEGIGEYTTTYTIVNYFCFFAMLGINNYGNRELAKVTDKDSKSCFFWELIIFRFIVTSILIVVYFLVYINHYTSIVFAQSILLFGSMIDLNWAYYGLEKIKSLIIKNLIIKIITTIMIFILVKNKDDLFAYTLIISIGIVGGQILLWPGIIKEFGFKKIRFSNLRKHIKPMFVLFIPIIGLVAYRMIDKTMIGLFLGNKECGYYESADKIIGLCTQILAAIGTILMPRISNLISTKNQNQVNVCLYYSFFLNAIFSLPIAFGIFLISNDFTIVFFGDEFYPTILLLQILSISLIFSSFSNLIRTGILIPTKMDKEYVWTILLGAIINIFLNFFVIYYFKNTASIAVTTLICEFILLVLEIIITKNKFNYKRIVMVYLFSFLSAILMCGFVYVFFLFVSLDNKIARIFISIIFGILIYSLSTFLWMYFFDKKDFNYFIDKIFKKNKVVKD